MLRELFTSRLFLGGLLCCVLIVAGSLFWSQHVKRELREREAETRRFVQQVEKRDGPRHRAEQMDTVAGQGQAENLVAPDDFSPTAQDAPDTPSLDTDAESVASETEPFLEETVVADATVEVPVSPFGWGPYPEVPAGFPIEPSWTWSEEKRLSYDSSRQRDFELMGRVLVKLWHQGDREFVGVYRDDQNGLVYPTYPNTAYVDWRESTLPNGEVVKYPGGLLSGPGAPKYIPLRDFFENGLPSGIRFIDWETGGINPYEFLGLE